MPRQALIYYLLPPGILLCAVLLAVVLLRAAPEAHKKPPTRQAALVDIAPLQRGDFPFLINATGEVVAAHQIELAAQVSGEIVAVAPQFAPGGLVRRGDMLLQIDRRDYELELARQQAAYEIEQGQQEKARKELQIVQQGGGNAPANSYLVLRGPQLKQAEADLQRARLNLARTTITAPFNAMIVNRQVDLGAKVSTQQALASLVDTDEYWVQAAVAADEAAWLDSGTGMGQGSQAQVQLQGGRGGLRSGRVQRVIGRLDERSRLVPVIVSVNDPLLLHTDNATASPMLLGDYVAVTLYGRTLQDVYRTPHAYLRQGNVIWTARNEKMVFVPVEVLHKDRDYVYFRAALQPDERIVTSSIAIPVDGMAIEISARSAQQDGSSPGRMANAGDSAATASTSQDD